jgi:hypothetical protein
MRTILRLSALAVVVMSLALWFFSGPNLGWTKTSVPIAQKEPTTGQDNQIGEKRFLPGVDFLGLGLIAAGILFGSSCFFRPQAPSENERKPLA